MNHNITEEEKHSRNDRIAYIYLMLRNDKTKNYIHSKIEELRITSRRKAEKAIKKEVKKQHKTILKEMLDDKKK